MGLYKFFCIFMDSNGSLWELISSYAFFLVLMGRYMSLEILMGPYKS